MQLVHISTLLAFAASGLAADCFGNSQNWISQFADAYWDARSKMCANTACAYQQDCTTSSSKSLSGLATVTVNVEIKRKKTGSQAGFPDCWDATENIINQCVYDEQKMSGTWEANGQEYQVNAWYS